MSGVCVWLICVAYTGARGGPIGSRVTVEVVVVGSNLTWDSWLPIDRPKARERELAKFNSNRRA